MVFLMLKIFKNKTICNNEVVKVDRETSRNLLDFITFGMQEDLQNIVGEHAEIVDLNYLNWLLLFYKKDKIKKQMELNKAENKKRDIYLRCIARCIKCTEEEIKKVEICIKEIEDTFLLFCKQDLRTDIVEYTEADAESVNVTEQSINSSDYSLLCSVYREALSC